MSNETNTIGLLVGSRRKNSFNRQLASLARTMLEEKGQKVEMIDWLDVPFFSQDDEFPTPEAVKKVRDEVMGCSVIWIFTPQYNGQIPGAEKNLLAFQGTGTWCRQGADCRIWAESHDHLRRRTSSGGRCHPEYDAALQGHGHGRDWFRRAGPVSGELEQR